MTTVPRRFGTSALLAFILATSACAIPTSRGPSGTAPAPLLGAFEDDYGGSYVITKEEWRHGAAARYHILKWDTAGKYLIALNGAANPTGAGLWTRIDWIPLTDMPPYEWAFCMTAYEAPSAVEAERTATAQPATPRTGCNGHPYSRMKRASAGQLPAESRSATARDGAPLFAGVNPASHTVVN